MHAHICCDILVWHSGYDTLSFHLRCLKYNTCTLLRKSFSVFLETQARYYLFFYTTHIQMQTITFYLLSQIRILNHLSISLPSFISNIFTFTHRSLSLSVSLPISPSILSTYSQLTWRHRWWNINVFSEVLFGVLPRPWALFLDRGGS